MLAFHNDHRIKEKYLNRVKAHAAADEFIKGKIGETFRVVNGIFLGRKNCGN